MEKQEMSYPIQLVLEGRKCVVVGGGKVAARKVEALRRAGAQVHVISPEFDEDLRTRQDITRHVGPYEPGVLTGATLVMICTDDRTVNALAAADGRAAGALVNVADDPEYCDFYVPAMVRRGPIQIAIGTGGASPELAATLRRMVERAIPEEFAELAEELRRIRPIVKHRISRQPDRARLFAALCDDDSIRRYFTEGISEWRAWFEKRLSEASDR
jgi:precorrin-2 dehydrogenase / sirohydrochlorin ferrochelatase